MALWHVDFHLVPRRAVSAPDKIAPAAFDSRNWWAADAFPSDYRARLDQVAPRAQSSSASLPGVILESWGNEDENRIDVWSEGGRVQRVTVRVDVRRLDSKFGASLLHFVRTSGAMLMRGDGLVIDPIINAYASALRTSDAWRFANDPAAHIASYTTQDEEDG
jgi:hypothetical protein